MSPAALAPAVLTARVQSSRQVGEYRSLVFSAPEIAREARAGQFVNLESGSFLRRPFSVYHATGAGDVEVVFDAIGPGTEWLAGRVPGDPIGVVGPLGRAYEPPAAAGPCLLVGGGYGAAPLFFLAESLRGAGASVHMIMGAARAQRVLEPAEARRVSDSVVFTTEDGSLGVRGRVTDVLREQATAHRAVAVYACGPMPMLAAVSRAAGEIGLPVQVAVEEFMACGIGVCWTCVLPVRDSDGKAHKRACTDGPVFDGARVDWGEA